jgi:hypothetical protein
VSLVARHPACHPARHPACHGARVLPALGLGLAVWAASEREARAEVVIGIEPRAELVVREAPRVGPALATFFGYSLELYPVLLEPELELNAAIFPGDGWFGSIRAMAGLRAGITLSVEPSIYVHAGYGLVGSEEVVAHGFAIDAGAALDGRLSREVTLGGALGYQGVVAGQSSLHGLVAGLHASFWF